MHIVLLAHTRFPLRQPFHGGLESMTWHLARGLAEHGMRVSLLAAPGSTPIPGVEFLDAPALRLSEAARADVSMPDTERIEAHHTYLRAMLELTVRNDVDIVHNHSLHHLPIALQPLLAAPLLTTLHTPPVPWLESAVQCARALRGTGMEPRFLAVSAHTSAQWRHLVDARVVHCGVDTELWRQGPGGEALAWSGRLVPEKAPTDAIAIARAAGLPLRIAGPVPDPDYFDAEIRPRLGGGVEYVGHLRTRELAALVGESAAALVTPDWEEPFGLVAAEALSCGTPLLAWRRGGLPEIVPKGSPMLVRPGDVDAAVDTLEDVLAYPREDCRRHAVDSLSLAAMVRRHLEIYAGYRSVVPA
ncbi:glycosyltransferase [Gulosibacter sp. 10]|uniref:glycosyltransferase n=1 Tax=Gulosibacter sp. 10 TaxID=1255570 RepID=UPI00097E9D93|nr:glycosyltransferase [Gulosibacter sp. 10]SJM48957.1 Glycosyl transferase, group 1 [Gulosibacter sp. 10]